MPGVERKGALLPYTSLDGHMFSFLGEDGVVALRLSAPDRATFIGRFSTTLHEAHGRSLKEYVSVPPSLLADTNALTPWFAASLTYVSGLKPKATTRSRSDKERVTLERAARISGRSAAELIPEGVDVVTNRHQVNAPTLPLFESGLPDLAEHVDDALEGFGEA